MPFWQSRVIKTIYKYIEPLKIENEKREEPSLLSPPMQLSYGTIHEFTFELNPSATFDVDVRGPPNPVSLYSKEPSGFHMLGNSKLSMSHEVGPTLGVEAL